LGKLLIAGAHNTNKDNIMSTQTPSAARRASRASYAAEIIQHTRQHPCGSLVETKLLAITDLDKPGARSVTNAVEEVLEELVGSYGMDLPSVIIYRNTTGVWDGISHIEGTFRGFYPIRETDRDRAIDKALGREPGSIPPNRGRQPCQPR
jgi:hypothetical protein